MTPELQTFILSTLHHQNKYFFGGKCNVANVYIVQQMLPGAAGLCNTFTDGRKEISISEAYVQHFPLHGAKRLFCDLLLHELIHAYIGADDFEGDSHDSPRWIAELERLTPMLGLPAQSEFSRFERRLFPMALTAPSFYRDAPKRERGITAHKAEWLPYLFNLKPTPFDVSLFIRHGLPVEIDAINKGIDNPILLMDLNTDTRKLTISVKEDTTIQQRKADYIAQSEQHMKDDAQ